MTAACTEVSNGRNGKVTVVPVEQCSAIATAVRGAIPPTTYAGVEVAYRYLGEDKM